MNNFKTLIVIPARYGSSRFPGKPLAKIAGKTLLERVCEAAKKATAELTDVGILVATDDQRIMDHAAEIGVAATMTPESCATGTDRILAAVSQLTHKPQTVINLQGDAPLTPVIVIKSLLHELLHDSHKRVVTPVVQLSWSELDSLRQSKINTPFSGTTAILNSTNDAIWFSKQIIPAIRNENELRKSSNLSPVFQHLGLYGYSLDMLEVFSNLPPSPYEKLEGLEQLRLLENGYKITAIPVVLDNLLAWRGVDTIEDAKFVEHILNSVN